MNKPEIKIRTGLSEANKINELRPPCFKIPKGLSRAEIIEWEIDNRLNGGKPQLDLSLTKLFDLSEKFNKRTNINTNKKIHPNDNKEPTR